MKNEVGFDLTHGGALCRGTLRFENGVLTAFTDNEKTFEHDLKGVSEIIQRTYSGCGSIELKPENADRDNSYGTEICRFSMSRVDEIAELCKVVNHFIETGEETELSRENLRCCPKCGRHYAKGLDVCLFCVEKTYLFSRTFEFARPYAAKMAAASILIMLSSGFTAMLPVLNAKMLDGWLYTDLPADEKIRGVTLLACIIGLTQLAGALVGIVSRRISNRVSCDLSADLRLAVYDKIQRLSLSSMSKKTAGDLMKRVTKDTETVKRFITEQGMYAVEKLLMFVVILIILLRISPILTLIIFVPVPAVIFAISRFWAYMRLRYEKQWRSESRTNSILHDIVNGIRVVKTFGSEEREIKKFDSVCRKLAEVSIKNEQLWACTFPFLSFFMGIGEFFVLYFGGRLVLSGEITGGELLEFTLFSAYIYGPLRWLSNLPRRLGEAVTSMVKIFEIIDEKQDASDSASDKSAELNGDIEFSSVRFGYKSYEPVLRDINLRVKNGEMIGLVGHSGAGKSTLINLIMRLYDADSGSIKINGRDIRDMDPESYRSKIGVVFQETFLFAGTVYDNIAYSRPDAEPSEIIAAAKAANAHEFIIKLPDGYNTVVGENGHNLSGGERQRISIARAVLKNPEILILDEATSALDPETESSIQEALARLVKGRTTFAIAHRLSTLKNADRLVVIENGRIAETGTHRELLMQNGIYASLVMAQKQTSKLNN